MLIYVAGPLTATTDRYIQNVSKMLNVAVNLRRLGHCPYVPCMDILLGLIAGDWEYKDYFDMNFAFIGKCDALFFMESSPGADRELEYAKKLGLKIFYKLSEVPNG